MDPNHRVRISASRRFAEQVVQAVAQRAVELVVEALDVNALIARIDPNAVLVRVELNDLLGRVDINQVLDRVDTDQVLDRADVDKLLDRVDIDQALDRVDIDQVLDRVDIDLVLDRVDINRILDRVDIDQVLDRADVDKLMARVDINEIAGRIDIEALVANTDLGALMASSSSTLTTEAVDRGRSHAVSMDDTIARWVSRLRRNHARRAGPSQLPKRPGGAMTAAADAGPAELVPPDGIAPRFSTEQNPRADHAGLASRFIAFVFDCAVSTGVFLLVLGAASFAANVLTGGSILYHRGSLWVVLAFWAWEFLYYAYFWTTSGKTPGMTLLGVRVVGQDGSDVSARRGLVRTLAFPLSFLLLGLGFLVIVFGRDRRALHDSIAGTAVVYAWDPRVARLRSLAREGRGRPS